MTAPCTWDGSTSPDLYFADHGAIATITWSPKSVKVSKCSYSVTEQLAGTWS